MVGKRSPKPSMGVRLPLPLDLTKRISNEIRFFMIIGLEVRCQGALAQALATDLETVTKIELERRTLLFIK